MRASISPFCRLPKAKGCARRRAAPRILSRLPRFLPFQSLNLSSAADAAGMTTALRTEHHGGGGAAVARAQQATYAQEPKVDVARANANGAWGMGHAAAAEASRAGE